MFELHLKIGGTLKKQIAIFSLIGFFVLLVNNLLFANGDPFDIQLGSAVFRLEHTDTLSRSGQEKPEIAARPDGTSFVIAHSGRHFLVSARHVVKQSFDLRARVPVKKRDSGEIEVVELRIPKESWISHPIGPHIKKEGNRTINYFGVDVAVVPLPGIIDRKYIHFLSCEDDCPEGKENQLATEDPRPPLSIIVAGYSGDIGFKLGEQRPMMRSGIVSLVSEDNFLSINSSFIDERAFLIDCSVRSGNSGSPIFNINPFSKKITLVGLIIASNNNWEYAIAEPVSRIIETIEQAIDKPPTIEPSWHIMK